MNEKVNTPATEHFIHYLKMNIEVGMQLNKMKGPL
jgi:hypothetical protein